MNLLSKHDFEIKYIEGKENKVVDALSWRPFVNAITLIHSNLAENIRGELEHDTFYAPILLKIAQAPYEKKSFIWLMLICIAMIDFVYHVIHLWDGKSCMIVMMLHFWDTLDITKHTARFENHFIGLR